MFVDNIKICDVYIKLKVMEESSFVFALTGSRFFSPHRHDSTSERDYDFFVQYNLETESFLEKIGFVVHTKTNYKDSNAKKVMRFNSEKTHIDVQLVNDFDLMMKAQKVILRYSSILSLCKTKDDTTVVWNLVLAALSK